MTRNRRTRRWAGLARDPTGSVAVEFALISGALLMFTLGTIELGLTFWSLGVLQNAAEQTARCAAIASPNCSNVPQFAVNTATPMLFTGALTTGNVTVTSNTSCNGVAGTYVKVTISITTWAGSTLLPALSRPSLSAQACYPVSI
jgi:Flp pilus assembly protein TadG